MLLQAILASVITCISAKMEGKIVGGADAKITNFPHMVLLQAVCNDAFQSSWICGSSIINQRILLTAAHCLDGCDGSKTTPGLIEALAGTASYTKLTDGNYIYTKVKKVKIHENFDEITARNDIGIVSLMRDLTLGTTIKRVIVPLKYPDVKTAYVAGWGIVDDEKGIASNTLKYTTQKITHEGIPCKYIEQDRICVTTTETVTGWPSRGDSGSALVTSDFKIIGLVSMRIQKYLQNTVYTNVTYFYNWIKYNSRKLYCKVSL